MLTDIILELIFTRLPLHRQADFMKRRGIVLGTRNSGNRQGYLYMVNNLFAEIYYQNDNPQMQVERLVAIKGLNNLSSYLEKDARL